ncbi:hypothetical protein V1282_006699 [Nitrobacteraceae bacterium AZCC 2146]|jgi:hypothetical protein
MKAIYKVAAMTAAVFSTLAIVGTVGSGAAMAATSNGGPNDAYCLNDVQSGSPWCGYATFSQCEESASGIGADCVANVFREENHPVHSARRHTSINR